jgi:hypothetical protein
MPVTHHQPVAALVALTSQPDDVRVHLRLERRRQHPAGTIKNNLIERRTHLRAALTIGHYSQHRRSFLTGAPTPADLVSLQPSPDPSGSSWWAS